PLHSNYKQFTGGTSMPLQRPKAVTPHEPQHLVPFVVRMSAVHRGALHVAACAAILASSALMGQQAAQQEPASDAQVHTGTSSGLNGDTRIQNLLADHQYFRVQSQLEELPPEQAQL